ncbi:hypothetical protein [Tardiphaga sp. 813_E8_N1_3]|uniref:hypothetical protein n=1 Tax=Tardiphaga sp. 813_E8_N1_3 TaxID=3240760 RepID=UPI003F1E78F9
MEKQIVLFLDFLGFAEASKRMGDNIQNDLLSLLKTIADLRSEFSITTEDIDNGSKRHSLKPTVSTFSDHIVLSYPLGRFSAELGSSTFMILSQIHEYAARIALMALRLGFLIRGGVAVGSLYHSGGVVFGEAMVDAYNLESKIAVYPRIVVADALLSEMKGASELWIRRDFDGLLIVNYLSNFILKCAQPGVGYWDNVKNAKNELIDILRNNVEQLTSKNSVAALSKWIWFSKNLRRSFDEMHPHLITELGYTDGDFSWLK